MNNQPINFKEIPLTQLFSHNPEELASSEDAIERIINEQRAERQRYLDAEAAGKRPRKARKKKNATPIDPNDFSFMEE